MLNNNQNILTIPSPCPGSDTSPRTEPDFVLHARRFCTDCKNKVLRAYNILIGELDCSKEKGYCAALYEGLRCCPHERHIHVCCETDFIAHLLGRAEPEFAGGYEYVIG